MYIFAADLSAAQRRSILGHKNFRDSDWSANNSQPSSEPIHVGESCTLLGDMLLIQYHEEGWPFSPPRQLVSLKIHVLAVQAIL